jgi:hypothetical protein
VTRDLVRGHRLYPSGHHLHVVVALRSVKALDALQIARQKIGVVDVAFALDPQERARRRDGQARKHVIRVERARAGLEQRDVFDRPLLRARAAAQRQHR